MTILDWITKHLLAFKKKNVVTCLALVYNEYFFLISKLMRKNNQNYNHEHNPNDSNQAEYGQHGYEEELHNYQQYELGRDRNQSEPNHEPNTDTPEAKEKIILDKLEDEAKKKAEALAKKEEEIKNFCNNNTELTINNQSNSNVQSFWQSIRNNANIVNNNTTQIPTPNYQEPIIPIENNNFGQDEFPANRFPANRSEERRVGKEC